MEERKFLTRRQASAYLTAKYFPCAAASLARMATQGGGPIFRKAGLMVLYEQRRLDEWAAARVSGEFQNTTEVRPKPVGKPLGRPRKVKDTEPQTAGAS